MGKIHEFQVTCQQTKVSHVSDTWAPTNKSCTIKWEVRGGNFFLQILELTGCSHAGLFVDSHPKVTCQTQEISGRIPERGQTRLLSYSASTSGNKKRKGVCWRGTYELFRWKQSINSKSHALVTFLIPEHRMRHKENWRLRTSRVDAGGSIRWGAQLVQTATNRD